MLIEMAQGQYRIYYLCNDALFIFEIFWAKA